MNLLLEAIDLPIRIRTERKLTDEELLEFCRANEPARVERDADGELIVMSPTGLGGGSMETEVAIELGIWARQDGRGRVLGSTTGMTLPDGSVRAPDAAWVSERRWNALTAEQRKSFGRLCPEFVIEVRSETDTLRDLQAKMTMWIGNGVELAWLIDPLRRVVEVYRASEPPDLLQDPTSVQGTGCVRGFELVMSRIWS
jgi:Uma2 family endonuclease